MSAVKQLATNEAGELAAHNYRFDEAAALLRRGLALKPRDPQMISDLGMHLLRTGDEPGAREALEASFKLFPRDKPTLNLLGMLDKLDNLALCDAANLVQMQAAFALGLFGIDRRTNKCKRDHGQRGDGCTDQREEEFPIGE